MNTITPEIVAETEQLATVVKINSLAPETAQSLQSSFLPLFTEARSILEKSKAITVTDPSQKLEMKLARECRLALRNVRVSAEKLRKDLKEDSVRKGKAIDGFNNILLHLIDGEETRLEEQEKFVEKLEAQKKAQIKTKREEQLSAFNVDTRFYSLGEMDEAAYQQLLANTIAAEEKRREDARKAEIARIEKEKADAEERERIRLENERLRKEAVEREEAARIEREKAVAAKKAADDQARKEREAIEAKHADERRIAAEAAAIEKRRVDAERIAAEETARQERLRLQALAEVERQKTAAAEAELRAQREAAEKKAKAEALAAKKAASAPDKDKLVSLAKALDIHIPEMTTDDGKIVMQEFLKRQHDLIQWLKTQFETL